MKDKKKEKRVVNIDKDAHEIIKKYCDENALDLPKWLVKIALKIINKEKE